MKFLVSWKLCVGEPADAAQRPVAPGAEQRVGVVLDQGDVGPVRQHPLDARRVAGDAGVVDDHDGTDVSSSRVGEVGRGPGRACRGSMSQNSSRAPWRAIGERGGGERERRDDDGVVGAEVEQHRRQLERRGARGGQQHLLGAGRLRQQRAGPGREARRRRTGARCGWRPARRRARGPRSTVSLNGDARAARAARAGRPMPVAASAEPVHQGRSRPSSSAQRLVARGEVALQPGGQVRRELGCRTGAPVGHPVTARRDGSRGRRPAGVEVGERGVVRRAARPGSARAPRRRRRSARGAR